MLQLLLHAYGASLQLHIMYHIRYVTRLVFRLSEEAHRLLVRSLCNVLLLSWPGLQEQKWEDRKKHLGQKNHNFTAYYQCFGSGVVYIGFRIRVFLSRIQGKKDPGSGSASKILSIFNQNIFFIYQVLLEI